VKLLGPGFSYTAKSDFEGQDSFTIQISGMLNGIRGSSDIRIIVSVEPKSLKFPDPPKPAPQKTPTCQQVTYPCEPNNSQSQMCTGLDCSRSRPR
jgi:hypothetical protein